MFLCYFKKKKNESSLVNILLCLMRKTFLFYSSPQESPYRHVYIENAFMLYGITKWMPAIPDSSSYHPIVP